MTPRLQSAVLPCVVASLAACQPKAAPPHPNRLSQLDSAQAVSQALSAALEGVRLRQDSSHSAFLRVKSFRRDAMGIDITFVPFGPRLRGDEIQVRLVQFDTAIAIRVQLPR